MNHLERDKCFGRRLARTGAAHVLITRSADRVPTSNERVMFWRWRANQPGLGNQVFRFTREPVPDCPQPETPFKPIEYVSSAASAAATNAPH